jgi:hypothetical protein
MSDSAFARESGCASPHGFLKDFQALPVTDEALEASLKKAVTTIDSRFGWQAFRRESVVRAFCESPSFAAAKKNADQVAALSPLSLPEAKQIARASVTNNQIHLPDELKHRVKRLLRDHIDQLDSDLRKQVDNYFP